jgi:hypothetical protein
LENCQSIIFLVTETIYTKSFDVVYGSLASCLLFFSLFVNSYLAGCQNNVPHSKIKENLVTKKYDTVQQSVRNYLTSGTVASAHNPSYIEGGDWEDHGLRPD